MTTKRRKHTDKYKRHMSKIMKIRAPWKGKKLSDEHKAKLKIRAKERWLKKCFKEIL